MVVQSKENQTTSSLAELLGGSSQSKNNKSSKSNDVFAQLLSTFRDPKKGAKTLVNKDGFAAIIDPKKDNTPAKLKSTEIKPLDVKKLTAKGLSELLIGTEDESKTLPKDLLNVLSNDQVHSLIQRAKDYLKNAITEKSPELKANSKALPKTLLGLVELAHKIGIDLSEITLSTIDKESINPLKGLPAPLLAKPLFELKGSAKEALPEHSKRFEAIAQLLQEAKPTELKAVEAKASSSEAKDFKVSSHPLQSLLKGLDKSTEMVAEISKDTLKETGKDRAQSVIPAGNADALSALLRGNTDGETHKEKEEIKPLTELGKSHQPLKADSLEVKSKEAVQSMRHFAIDLKEAAESYKPPFTRLTMRLNPERLGEVDVTLIQRGNNVHVTIQSNNAASVAFLAHNATELKAQLAQQGVTNTTMNFMTSSDNQQQNPQQQQQQQNENRFRAYASLEELQHSSEELSALEIIIPHYA